jgi:hypothetical protein
MRMPDKSPAKCDSVALAFLIAMGLAVATTTGAALSGMAGGAMQSLMHRVGFGASERIAQIEAAQQRQAAAVARFEASLDQMRRNIADLAQRADRAASAAARRPDSAPNDIALAALRSSFDEQTERTRGAFIAVNKRIDWLETLVYRQDATGSVQPSPTPPAPSGRRRGARSGPEWQVLHAENGVAVIAGKSGAIDVTPGIVVPQLGRVAVIRKRDGRWEVVTEKGTITQR